MMKTITKLYIGIYIFFIFIIFLLVVFVKDLSNHNEINKECINLGFDGVINNECYKIMDLVVGEVNNRICYMEYNINKSAWDWCK